MAALKPSRYGSSYVAPQGGRLVTQFRPLPAGRGPAPLQYQGYRSAMQSGPPDFTPPAGQDQGGTGIPPYGPGSHGAVLPSQNDYPTTQTGTGNNTTQATGGNPNLDALLASYRNEITQARASALSQQKNLLLGFGSRELASKILGAKDPLLALISDNPDASFSTLAKLNYALRQNTNQENEYAGSNNLFYGGGRNLALQQINRGHLQDVDTATKQAQSQLDLIQQTLMATIRNIQTQIANAIYNQQSQGSSGV